MYILKKFFAFVFTLLLIFPAHAEKLELGVNLESLGFSHDTVPAKLNHHYFRIPESDFDFYLAHNIKLFRIPIIWERLQPELYGDLDITYLSYLNHSISYALARGGRVIIDLHNYAKRTMNGKKYTIGDKGLPAAALTDFWLRLGRIYANNDKIAFCIMNEPLVKPAQKWANMMQDLTLKMREAKINNELQISGIAFTGAWNWHSSGNAAAYENFHDPINNFLFEVHQYNDLDKDGSAMGMRKNIHAPNIFEGVKNLTKFTQWARHHKFKAHLGEMATTSNDLTSMTAYKNAILFMKSNSDVWVSHTAWGGGSSWGKNYPFRIQATNGKLSNYGKLLVRLNK